MRRFVLPNGLTVLIERARSDSVAVEVSVGVGSIHERHSQAGIAHLVEHMLFNGSGKRPTAFAITNEIEKLGGMLNGGTSNEQTCFYGKVQAKHVEVLLDVFSDVLLNPLFKPGDIEKERKVVLNEIQLFTDDPKLHIWVLLQRHLYRTHPAGNPVYGRKESIAKITRGDLLEFYRRNYVPTSMAVTVVGGVDERRALKLVHKYFGGLKAGAVPEKVIPAEPRQAKAKTFKERRRILQSYLVFAFKTPPRSHPDSYALDVIDAILGRRSSGRLFDEIRNKQGLAYEVSVENEALRTFGFFAVFVVADKRNLKKIVRIIREEFSRLHSVSPGDIAEAKTFIEGDFLLENEDTVKRAELLSFFNHAGRPEDALAYLKKIRAVSLGDVRRVAKKYLRDNYTLVVVG